MSNLRIEFRYYKGLFPIELAKNIKRIESVSVSTDSRKIANISKYYGADIPFIRSKKLSSSKANGWDVWKDFVIKKNFKSKDDVIVILPVTSPFRIKKDVERCISLYKKKNKVKRCITNKKKKILIM